MRSDSLALACAALAVLGAALPERAVLAQDGAGAERYEITITPPKRPGSEPPAVETAPATGEAAPTAAGDAPSAAPAPAAPAAGETAKASAPASPDPAAAKPAANLPLRTLQVGAYRQLNRAEQLHEALSPTFPDVVIAEVQSGGEPLYRVNVGKLPRGPQLEDLKKRLAAAGFPAFEVLVPKD